MEILECPPDYYNVDNQIKELSFPISLMMSRYKKLFTSSVSKNPVIAVSIEQTEEKPSATVIEEHVSESEIIDPSPQKKKKGVILSTDLEHRYAQYNVCRSFPSAAYPKHVNLELIKKRATSGLIIVRPHEKKSASVSNTPIFISQVLVRLTEKGNKGQVSAPSGVASPILLRNLPSTEDLEKGTVLTPEVLIRRGPGRPYGSLTVNRNKRSHKDLSSGHSNSKSKSKKKQRVQKPKVEKSSSDDFDLPTLEEPDYELRGNDLGALVDVFDINSLVRPKERFNVCLENRCNVS